jgi:siroheme synthase (precorrin-2 oxidase/ferrochelatase)
MTPTEMRRRAVRDRARAAALDSAAARLRVIADTIRPLLAGLSEQSRQVWRGPAATDFEHRTDAADADVRAQAALLVDTAVEFEAEGRRLRAAAASLEAGAAAADAVAAAAGGAAPHARVE